MVMPSMILKLEDVPNNTTVTLPLVGFTSAVRVNWGDGTTTTNAAKHVYANTENTNYTISITETSNSITGFGNADGNPWSGSQYLTTIQEWGDFPSLTKLNLIGNMALISVPNYIPSTVTDMSSMFQFCDNFNDPNIIIWDVSNVLIMDHMFYNASILNQPIGVWNVSKVTSMLEMFLAAIKFNQDLSNWDVSKVINASQILFVNRDFNQDLSNWNVEKMTNMSDMFNLTSFNQNLARWNIRSATNMSTIFNQGTIDTLNYTATLIGWAAIAGTLNPNDPDMFFLGGGETIYESARAAYTTLTSPPLNWIITPSIDAEFDTPLTVIPTPQLNFEYNAPTTRAYNQGVAINPYIPSFASLYNDVKFQISPDSPVLPAGLQIDQATGKISGTPTATTLWATYTINATANNGVIIKSFHITLSVINNVSYIPAAYVFLKNTEIVPITPTVNAGTTIITYFIAPAISNGLTFNTTTGIITGTPNSVLNQTYIITAFTSSGKFNNSINIVVDDITYTSTNYTFLTDFPILSINPVLTNVSASQVTFSLTDASWCSIGLHTGIITGNAPSINGTFKVNAQLGTYRKVINFTFNVATITYSPLSYTFIAGVQILPLAPIVPENFSDISGSYYTCSVLPVGLTLGRLTGIISGSPTTAGSSTLGIDIIVLTTVIAKYYISVAVADITYATLSYNAVVGIPIAPITPTKYVYDASTNLSVTTELPDGLTMNNDGIISGTLTPTGFYIIMDTKKSINCYSKATLSVPNTTYKKTITFRFELDYAMIMKFSFSGGNNKIELPLFRPDTGKPLTSLFRVDWGDGNITEQTLTHNYLTQASSKIYTVIIVPNTLKYETYLYLYIKFGALDWTGSNNLLAISEWGPYWFTTLNYIGGQMLTGVPSTFVRQGVDIDASHMFDGSTNFNDPNVSQWNVSTVTNMSYMFHSATSFNHSLKNWYVTRVKNFSYIFYNTKYNQTIKDWVIGKDVIKDGMKNMFGPFR